MVFFFFLFFARNEEYLTPGYRTTTFSDSSKVFILNSTLDNIFLFDDLSNYIINVKFLDMIEYEQISPVSNGFSGFLLNEVEITQKNVGTHSIEIFSLPTSLCSHNFITYYTTEKRTMSVVWSKLERESFNACYLYQYSGHRVDLSARIISNSKTKAFYLSPNDYSKGNYSGVPISKSDWVNFHLEDGLILKIDGSSSPSRSSFDVVVNPLDQVQPSKRIFKSISYYFVVSQLGYDFLSSTGLQLENVTSLFFKMDINSIIGVTLSSLIFLIVVILTGKFLYDKFWNSKRKII